MKTFGPLFLFPLSLLLVGIQAFSLRPGYQVPRITSSRGRVKGSTRRPHVLVEVASADYPTVSTADGIVGDDFVGDADVNLATASISFVKGKFGTSVNGLGRGQGPANSFEGEQDRTSLLHGTTEAFSFALGLHMACTLPALSRGWFCSLPMMVLASYAIARSTLPFAKSAEIEVSDEMYARNFGAHIFSATAIPILSSLMLPVFPQEEQKMSFLFGLLFMAAGSVSEILAHFQDSWVFEDGCKALQGTENAVFYIGLTGGFAFFALAFSPGLLGLSLAGASTAFLVHRAATRPWVESKGTAVAANAISSTALCAISAWNLRSAWPLLFYVQSFNIVRNSKRIIATEEQNLHLLPSAYGWFSYVFPFALSLHPATQDAGLWTVLGVCSLTIVGTDFIEQKIIEASTSTDPLVEPIKANKLAIHYKSAQL